MRLVNCHETACQSAVPSAHAVCLFGPSATRQSLSSRISDLHDVPIAENDGYPEHVCEKCKRRLKHLEKAAEDLENFRSQVNSSYIKKLLILCQAVILQYVVLHRFSSVISCRAPATSVTTIFSVVMHCTSYLSHCCRPITTACIYKG